MNYYDKPTKILHKWLEAAEEFAQYERGFLRFVGNTISATLRIISHYPKALDDEHAHKQFDQLQAVRDELSAMVSAKGKKKKRQELRLALLHDHGRAIPGGREILPFPVLLTQHAEELMRAAVKLHILDDNGVIQERARRVSTSIEVRSKAHTPG
jgi:hypothetical protein